MWQGGADEGLTCNALEWQAAQDGGQIIEEDQAISVNNPKAITAWQRARTGLVHSRPGVTGYREGDSLNVWVQGRGIHAELAISLRRQPGPRFANPRYAE